MAIPAFQPGLPLLSFGTKAPGSSRRKVPALGQLSGLPWGTGGGGVVGEDHLARWAASPRHTRRGVEFRMGWGQAGSGMGALRLGGS